ncbi:MAG: right-handed parallel beta-helix repeat-containing protein [Planctomycetota bacterium]
MEKRPYTVVIILAFVLVMTWGWESAFGYYIIAWGRNSNGQCDLPPGGDFVAIAAGFSHSLALKADGSLISWGANSNVPAGNDFVDIACGYGYSLGLRSDGSVVSWSTSSNVLADGDCVGIAAGRGFSLALKSDGSITGWGDNFMGPLDVPEGNDFVAIGAGYYHGLALRSDGSLAGWGSSTWGQSGVPQGNDFVAISSWGGNNAAFRSDGSVVVWGYNAEGQCDLPEGHEFVDIVGGVWHCVGLDQDGTVVAWGDHDDRRCSVPGGRGFACIAAGYHHCLALGQAAILLHNPNGGQVLTAGQTYSIDWVSAGPVNNVLIEYSTDDGQTWNDVGTVSNTGSYDWLVPAVHSDRCLVRVSDANDPNVNDASDSIFTIEIHVTVPDVVAMPLAGADSALVDANLVLGKFTYECNDAVPDGHVIGQNPAAGTEVVIGSTVGLVVSLCEQPSIPKYLYVDDDAPLGGNARSWSSAFKYLQDALDEAERTGTAVEIRVAGGIYRPDQNSANPDGSGDRRASFQLMNWVTTKGGYAGVGAAEANERDVELYQTILSGDLLGNDAGFDIDDTEEIRRDPNRKDNSRHVVIGSGTDATAILDGFTITGGHGGSSSGAGMCNETGSATLIDCLFTRNAADEGGGMFNEDGSNPTLIRCTFSQNALTDDFGGGGMCNRWNSNPTLYDCTFSQNCGTVGGSEGGGMENYRSSPTLINCVFISNMVNGDGGGMRNYRGSNPTVINCIFSGNVADDDGGGMFNRGSSPALINCTFGANSARAGGGIYNRDHRGTPSLPIITNCILWDDTPDEIYVASGTPEVSYCDVQGGWPGEGNIDTDPCFVEPGHWDSNGLWFDGDYHLLPSSPCIDTGDPNYVPGPNETDLDGNPIQ